ncbi:hypothetical protein NM688_g909 [Phlebia brevispora]|uniref:Uncharacterized protein n=1 Tax=Phlebia brevispora TaxID=194682 RepID=A0ACC1TD34_9APHY|nr:hypothetical protein NM688_g909 [Phlebia brevispora]
MLSFSTVVVVALALVSSVVSVPMRARQSPNFGDATFYEPGLGACGVTNSASDHIVAVSASFFDTFPGATANPNANPVCGRTLTANFQGKSTTVTVVDRCVGCALDDIDLSPAAFSDLADQSLGRIQVSWTLN